MVVPLPKRPWERVAADLFKLDGIQYLLVVDYYSRYPEVIQLCTTTSAAIVNNFWEAWHPVNTNN